MTDAIVHEAKVPTEDEAAAVTFIFGEFLEQLQHRSFEVKAFVEAQDEGTGPPPSFEDIGRLYSLIENLKLDRYGFGREIEELEEYLRQLYIAKDERMEAVG